MPVKSNLSESAGEVEPTAAAMSPNKRIGVVRYCQIRELSSGISKIMRNRYAAEAHTLAEWDELLDYVLHRKVGSV